LPFEFETVSLNPLTLFIVSSQPLAMFLFEVARKAAKKREAKKRENNISIPERSGAGNIQRNAMDDSMAASQGAEQATPPKYTAEQNLAEIGQSRD
jgi:hypothetical protein